MPTFCGLTVLSANVDGGLNDQRLQLRVDLVQDLSNGDSPLFPGEGTPIYFNFFGFSFNGLFQGYTRNVSAGGITYSVICTDASEILDAVAVITDGVYAASPVDNLINPFAWRENTLGFGESGVNASGMPWANVLAGINYFANSGFPSAYGAPPSYRGIQYGIDLTDIPAMPASYRVSSNGGSLLSLISQVCQDAGVDFFIDLIAGILHVKVIDRSTQNTLGAIQTAIDSLTYAGTVISSQIGSESRGETTSVVLNGGYVSGLFTSTSIFSYWGEDTLGNPVVGVPGLHADLPTEYNENFTLPAFEIADILGDDEYPSNLIEMRFALIGMSAWEQYVSKYKPGILALINPIFKPGVNAFKKPQLLNDDPAEVDKFLEQELIEQSYIIFSFVRKYAEQYYGKRFLARVPDVLVKPASPGSTLAVFSHEPDGAGYVDGGVSTLGFPLLDQPKFEAPDGRVLPFLVIPNFELLNPNEIDSSSSAIVGTSLVCRCEVASRLVVLNTNEAYARIELPSAIHGREEFDGGEVKKVINGILDDIENNGAGGTIGILSATPPVAFPSSVTVPLVSNIDRYGPWFASGADGKVRYEEDSSMVPWEYGSIANMNLAAQSRVLSGISLQTRNEAATFSFAGTPTLSIGQAISVGGPNLTSIQINYSTSGLTTTYGFQVFNPRLISGFARQRAEAQREANQITLDNRRRFTRAVARESLRVNGVAGAQKGRAFRDLLPNFVKKESPHDMLIGRAFQAVGDPETHMMVSTATLEEAMVLSNANSPEYENTAIMSLTGLVRPYQMNEGEQPATSLFPSLPIVSPLTGANSDAITSSAICPFDGKHDVDIMAWGDSYVGANAHVREPAVDGLRGMALTGPIAVAGIGYTHEGNLVPSEPDRRSGEDFKVGYLDLLYDENRGLWSVHDIFFGITQEGIAPDAFGEVFIGGESSWSVQAKNVWNNSIPENTKAVIGYSANYNHLIIVGVEPQQRDSVLDICVERGTVAGTSVLTGGNVTWLKSNGDTYCRPLGDCCGGGEEPPPPEEDTIDIEVTVVDAYSMYSETFSPVVGRQVSCPDATNSPQTTNSEGKVLLRGIPKGTPSLANITTAVTLAGSGDTVFNYWRADIYGEDVSGYVSNPYTSITDLVEVRFAIRDFESPFFPVPPPPPPPPPPPAPVADFVATPLTGDAPLEVTFTDTSSNSPTAWEYDFGDKSSKSYLQNPVHTYTAEGKYTVSLLATSDFGSDTETKTEYIEVTSPPPPPAPPVANFVGTPLSGPAPLEVSFTDTSTNSPTAWEYDFGDKSSKVTVQNPTHTYTVAGKYTVSLFVTNVDGSDTETKTDYVEVVAPLPPPPPPIPED